MLDKNTSGKKNDVTRNANALSCRIKTQKALVRVGIAQKNTFNRLRRQFSALMRWKKKKQTHLNG